MNQHIVATNPEVVNAVHVFPDAIAWAKKVRDAGLTKIRIAMQVIRTSADNYNSALICDEAAIQGESILSSDYPEIATSCIITKAQVVGKYIGENPIIVDLSKTINTKELVERCIVESIRIEGVQPIPFNRETIKEGMVVVFRNGSIGCVDSTFNGWSGWCMRFKNEENDRLTYIAPYHDDGTCAKHNSSALDIVKVFPTELNQNQMFNILDVQPEVAKKNRPLSC